MNSLKTILATIISCLLALTLMWAASPANAQGVVTAEAVVASNSALSKGSTITVDINIDVSGTSPARRLGSFTGSLHWDLEILEFESHSGVKASFTGVVNDANANRGDLLFNGANAMGASGKSNVLTVAFTVLTDNVTTGLDLGFTAMLAALDFTNLVPVLTVNDATITTAVDDRGDTAPLPKAFALGQNYPNPFNPETEITYELPRESQVVLSIYNLVGQKVRTLVNGKVAAGRHSMRWNGTDVAGRNLSSGVYIYRLEAAEHAVARRMVLVR